MSAEQEYLVPNMFIVALPSPLPAEPCEIQYTQENALPSIQASNARGGGHHSRADVATALCCFLASIVYRATGNELLGSSAGHPHLHDTATKPTPVAKLGIPGSCPSALGACIPSRMPAPAHPRHRPTDPGHPDPWSECAAHGAPFRGGAPQRRPPAPPEPLQLQGSVRLSTLTAETRKLLLEPFAV
jgi:hypothetical protein